VASKHHAVLLANHGPVLSGRDIETAVSAVEELEETAKLYFLLRGSRLRLLNPAQVDEIRRLYPS
jgi:ribulose-5-phosphate 4-epimerase/fuculose-1-phosphate aldolase